MMLSEAGGWWGCDGEDEGARTIVQEWVVTDTTNRQ